MSYEKTKYFCPGCGQQAVYAEIGAADFYAGSKYVCSKCGRISYLDDGDGKEDQEKLGELRKFEEKK